MTKLSINDWLMSPSIQLLPKITDTDADHYYHDHNFYEIFYIIDGTITHHYNGVKEVLKTGDTRLLRPGDKHAFIRKQGVACAHRDIIITEQLFKESCDFITPSLFEQINELRQPLKATLSQTKLLGFENDFSKMFLHRCLWLH